MEKEQHQVRHAYLEEYEGASLVAIEAYQCLEFIYPPGLWPSIQKMISDATQLKVGGELLVAVTGEGISGLVVYHAPGSDENRYFPPGWASVTILAVLPKYRRTGLGSKLLHACLDIAKSDKAHAFAALLNSRMVDAKKVFDKNGFSESGYSKIISGQQYERYSLIL